MADKDILYRAAYEEAVRALTEQQAEIDSFRNRAGLLFSSTAITTSFLGTHSCDGDILTPGSWLALAAFIGVAVTWLAILWPRPWELTADPRTIIDPYIREDKPVPIDELRKELSFHMHSSYVENRAGIRHLSVLLQMASGLLTLEVVTWILVIATGA